MRGASSGSARPSDVDCRTTSHYRFATKDLNTQKDRHVTLLVVSGVVTYSSPRVVRGRFVSLVFPRILIDSLVLVMFLLP